MLTRANSRRPRRARRLARLRTEVPRAEAAAAAAAEASAARARACAAPAPAQPPVRRRACQPAMDTIRISHICSNIGLRYRKPLSKFLTQY